MYLSNRRGSVDDKKCQICGKAIPKARLKVLPTTITCVRCSTEKSRVGAMVDIGDSTLELQMADPDNEYMKDSLKRPTS